MVGVTVFSQEANNTPKFAKNGILKVRNQYKFSECILASIFISAIYQTTL